MKSKIRVIADSLHNIEFLTFIMIRTWGGGYFRQNRTWMCLPNLKNLTFSIPIFRPITHPLVYHFQ